jgi:predicted porin
VATFNGSGADTGAKIYSLNYGYLLSKRTEVYGYYAKLDNDNNGRTNFAGSAALGITGGSLRGMDADIFGLGIAHSF